VNRDREHDEVRVDDGIGGPARLGSGCQDARDERDLVRIARGRDRHAVARVDCDTCDDRPDVPGSEHADPRV